MFFDQIHRARSIVLLAFSAILLASISGLTKLETSADNRIFYGPKNPYFSDYVQFEAEFSTNDNVLFVITAPYTVQEQDFPAAIRWLTNRVNQLDGVTRVDSLSTYPHPISVDDELVVEPLLDWACPREFAQCQRDISPELARSHLTNRLVSADERSTGVLATLSIERGSVGTIERIHDEIRVIAEEFTSTFPGFEINYTGGVPMMAAFAQASADDLGVLLPCALLLISLLLYLVLGSAPLTILVVSLGFCSIIITLGVAGYAGHVLNNATSVVPLIIFTLVVASSMHVAVHFSRNVGPDASKVDAVAQAKASASSTVVPILLSATTSAVSLGSLWLVDSPPIRQLGILSAFGVAVGAVLTLTMLPIMLAHIRKVSGTRLANSVQSALNAYAKRLERREHIAGISILIFLFAAAGLTRLELNDDFVKFFDESVPFRISTDRTTELLAGPNHIEVIVTNLAQDVFQPDFLGHVADLTSFLRAHPLVANVHSFSDVLDEVSVAFSGTSASYAQSSDELAQLFLVYELSLQVGQSNTDLINVRQDSARIAVLLKQSTSNEIQSLERAIYNWSDDRHKPFKVIVTGENIPVAHLTHMNIEAMTTGIAFSLTFSALALGLVFRSAKLGLVALVATTIPVLAGFGLWGWMIEEIGLAATGIIALTIGVVVDDAAHYIYRYLDGSKRLDLTSWAAAGYATHRAGSAIVSTSVVLVIGLSLLLLSSFEVNSSFGAVACLIISTAVVFNLAVLPRLTVWAYGRDAKERGPEFEFS